MHAPNRNHTFIVKILVVYTPSAEYAHQQVFFPEQIIPLFISDPKTQAIFICKSFAGIPRNVYLNRVPGIRVFLKYCVFSLKFCDFSELCQFCYSSGFLPAWCVYTHCHRGKTEKGQSPEYSKIFEKNTIINERPVGNPNSAQVYLIFKF